MSVIAVTSSRTSPGATTLATGLATAWTAYAERSLLVEADPTGGVLALRFDLEPAPSLTSFGSDTRHGYSDAALWANTQDLRGVRCLAAPVEPQLARNWIERVRSDLGEHLPSLGTPVVIDLGCVSDDSEALPLAGAADLTLVVTRPDAAEVQALLFQVRRLQAAGATVALVTIGDTPNSPHEISDIAGVPLVAVLPDDPSIAGALCGGDFTARSFRRSTLWRTICGLGETIFDGALMESRIGVGLDAAASPPPPQGPMLAPPAHLDEAVPAAPTAQPTPLPNPAPHAAPHPMVAQPSTPRTVAVGPFDPTVELSPRLVVNELRLPDGTHHAVRDQLIIGRHRDCDIVLDDVRVSRRHVQVTRTTEGWLLTDLGSSNGTRLNGNRCSTAHLAPGDVIAIGQSELTFSSQPATGSLETTTHSLEMATNSLEMATNSLEMDCA